MISPIKKLNLDTYVEKLDATDSKYETIEVYFSPIHDDEYRIIDNKLLINFIRIRTSFMDDGVLIGEVPLDEYIEAKLKEVLQ
jgi:hypothetical protein